MNEIASVHNNIYNMIQTIMLTMFMLAICQYLISHVVLTYLALYLYLSINRIFNENKHPFLDDFLFVISPPGNSQLLDLTSCLQLRNIMRLSTNNINIVGDKYINLITNALFCFDGILPVCRQLCIT